VTYWNMCKQKQKQSLYNSNKLESDKMDGCFLSVQFSIRRWVRGQRGLRSVISAESTGLKDTPSVHETTFSWRLHTRGICLWVDMKPSVRVCWFLVATVRQMQQTPAAPGVSLMFMWWVEEAKVCFYDQDFTLKLWQHICSPPEESRIHPEKHPQRGGKTNHSTKNGSVPFLFFGQPETSWSFIGCQLPPLCSRQTERWKEGTRGGHFCIEELEGLIRTSWEKHEKESETGRRREKRLGADRGKVRCGWL